MEHRKRLETCVRNLKDWCASRRLQLNPDKTELIWFSSRANLFQAQTSWCHELDTLCSIVIEPVDSIRDLGNILDSELLMHKHIGKVSFICFFHIRRLHKLRPMLDQSSAQRLVSVFIQSRIDYCNVILADQPATTLVPLVHVLNAAARLVTGTNEVHTSEMMRSLHWLQIVYRILFKLCVFMHGIINGSSPAYLSDTTTRTSSLLAHGWDRQERTSSTSQGHERSLEEGRSQLPAHASGTLFPTTFETSLNFQHLNVPLRPITIKWHMVTKFSCRF